MKAQSALETPMMRQFLTIKAAHPDAIVFYRMGDFYEMFLDDAEVAAPLLDIALTTRDKGKADAVPMCGIPVHSADGYIKKLADLGRRIAICEQVEDPKSTGGKRLVRREVVEVITPGLVGDPANLEGSQEVAVAALARDAGSGGLGLAVLDASTGDFRAALIRAEPADASADASERAGEGAGGGSAGGVSGAGMELLREELQRVAPREILLDEAAEAELGTTLRELLPDSVLTVVDDASFDPVEAPAAPDGFDCRATDPATRAAAALLAYLGANQPASLAHAPRLRVYGLGDAMVLDAATRRHLELFENGEDRGRRGTLIEQIDATSTPLGARRLTRWLAYPLVGVGEIASRQAGVAHWVERDRPRARLQSAMKDVRDLERLLSKAMRHTSVPRDLGTLRSSLAALPEVRQSLLESAGADALADAGLPAALPIPEPVDDLAVLLAEALIDDPPVIARGSRGANETGYIRDGFRPELDALRANATKGREFIAGLEASERTATGINNLKVRFHPVHGYSLEVSKSQLAAVPDHYERKQTLANVERFTTSELREVESAVMGANERAAGLEREIFDGLRDAVVESAGRIRAAAECVAELDALASLAEVARREGWVRPEVNDGDRLELRGGRHPVVQAMLRAAGGGDYVPNDTELDPGDTQVLLLTGPNMSGKSTYLRQVALIALLAQTGSWVPADEARIGVVDRIFTRVGASDRLARGESTFMVEMRETAEILRQASRRSLVILDEIGRGTSTFDGLAIAWAVVEYLHDTPGLSARTLFATHYHELTDLVRTKPRVRNAHFEAKEYRDEVVFLRRLVAGGASRSYGIQVARLAGLPDSLIARARQILKNLENSELDAEGRPRLADDGGVVTGQLAFALEPETAAPAEELSVLAELRELNPNDTTPMDALLAIQRWRALLEGGES